MTPEPGGFPGKRNKNDPRVLQRQAGVPRLRRRRTKVRKDDICDGKNNDCDNDTIDGSGDPLVNTDCDGDDADVAVLSARLGPHGANIRFAGARDGDDCGNTGVAVVVANGWDIGAVQSHPSGRAIAFALIPQCSLFYK